MRLSLSLFILGALLMGGLIVAVRGSVSLTWAYT